ncbi:MAG TPA: CPBP family intramembrane glutamic endopeptidase [Acidobacteriaceae bacterium]|nr:CPBP family intramembrane glutamic endopeptidase [Acidobacteriaceae bacterium]
MDEPNNNPESSLSPSQEPSPAPPPDLFLDSLPPAPPPPTERGISKIFVAPNGLIRAGWGILIFAAVIFAAGFVISHLMRLLVHSHPHQHMAIMTPRIGILGEGLSVILIVVATGVMALIERKSILAYGYQAAARAVRFFSGLAWGFIAISVLVLVLWASHLLVFDGLTIHGGAILKYGLLWGFMFLLVGIFEESIMRGYPQFTLTRGIGFWWSALIFSFLFGFGHHANPGESPVGLFSAGAIGLVFCLSLWYTGSLWWAVGFHAAWDWGESFFYGTSDSGLHVQGHLFSEHPVGKILWSGGATGPEGSLYIIPLILLIVLGMWLWWGRRVKSPFAGQGWVPAWIHDRLAASSAPPESTTLPPAS